MNTLLRDYSILGSNNNWISNTPLTTNAICDGCGYTVWYEWKELHRSGENSKRPMKILCIACYNEESS